MEEQRPEGRLKVWTPVLFSLIMIAGMVLGFNLRDSLRNKRDIVTVLERNDRLEQIIDLIKEKYVDSVNTDALYDDAVNGILSHLDPHTVYITPQELQSVNEDLEGSFFGIGVEFSIIKDTIQVTSVIPSGPASKVNIEIGDQIIKVGDSLVAGTHISTDRIVQMLRGKEHSKVPVTVYSPLTHRSRKLLIERGSIPLYSIDASFMLPENVGYIRINRFSATTYEEFRKAMETLGHKGMTSLILDLRQNPGGYLDAATSIADDFLDSTKMILYTEGKHSKRVNYDAGVTNLFEKGKLVILVDESSASASEIVSGAVQDWDRGLIVGRRTFGKGLVQEQYDMDDGSALRLTIAKYYTPSGRSIQRSYAKGKAAYSEDFFNRFHNGELTGKDTSFVTDTTNYYTAHKRIVHGGGGITPDIIVPYDTSKYNNALLTLVYGESFRNAVLQYYLGNEPQLKRFKNTTDFIQNFDVTNLKKTVFTSTPALQKTITKWNNNKTAAAFIDLQMKAQLARILFKSNGYYRVMATDDNMIRAALKAMETNEYSQLLKGR